MVSRAMTICSGTTAVGRCCRLALAALGLWLTTSAVLAADDELAARLAKLESALDNRGLVDLLQRVERLQQETQELRGQIEDQQYLIERLRQTQRDSYLDIERRLTAVQPAAGATIEERSPAGEPPLAAYAPVTRGDVAGQPAPGIDVQVQSPDRDVATAPDTVVQQAERAPAGEDDLSNPLQRDPASAAQARADDEFLIGIDPETRMAPQPGDVLPSPDGTLQQQAAGEPAGSFQADPVDPAGAEDAYRDAFSLLKAGQYEQSIDAFNAFLLDYPTSEFADNAQYWLGETYFVKQDYPPAIEEYQKLVNNYPSSKKQSHAMLKIGYAYHRMGEVDKARAVLEDLRGRFPGTTAARLAAERIQVILAERTE